MEYCYVNVTLGISFYIPNHMVKDGEVADEYRLRELAMEELNQGADMGTISYEVDEQ
jgi:hypothetical protein